MNKKLHLVSLGCTKNLVDSEVMLGRLKEYEITAEPESADVIIINTCGFIDSAKKESLDTIFELDSIRKKDSLLICSGCLSERYKEELQSELPEVDIFTGVGDYAKIDEMIAKKESRFSDGAFLLENQERVVTGSNLHAYIKLSEGCNQRCSFCAIPLFKGELKSRPLEVVINEVESLIQKGFKEFTFISQDSSSYLRDFGEKEGLIKLINEIDKLDVLSAKVLYLYPSTTTKKLIQTILNAKKFENYFDMPLQHISAAMLKVMKRGSSQKRHLELLEMMRDDENSFVRTAFIVGHPKESDEDFEELCLFVKSFGFDRVNVFSYSDEEGTAAYRMKEKIEPKEIKQRTKKLEKIAQKSNTKALKNLVGKKLLGVIEGESSEHELLLRARPFRFAPEIDGEVLVNEIEDDKPLNPKAIYELEISELLGDKLLAKAKEIDA
ncbi:MAG: 30S ribosomal protein S12 methylthiotransferase RimO [Campylobacterales bacterium]